MADITGQRFGKQVVLRELGGDYVEIKCDCGTVKATRKQYVTNGQSKSCGCGRYAARKDTPPIEVGQEFFRLVVVEKLGTNGHKRQVLCRCSCGDHKVVAEGDLRSGTVKSCGCFRRERAAGLKATAQYGSRSEDAPPPQTKPPRKLHGESGRNKTMLYNTWSEMRKRVRNSPSYLDRGITVCPEWEESYEAFRDYVNENLGPRPDGHSLDRIRNEDDYRPGNVRWATPKEQCNNRSMPTRRLTEPKP